MRTLYGKEIRKTITDEFYPKKMSLEEFRSVIIDSFEPYSQNMKGIGFDQPKYIEEWFEQYLDWLDIEQEN